MRLQHFLSKVGIASRRKAEALIVDRQIRVNGVVVDQLGFQMDPSVDEVFYQGKRLVLKNETHSWILYKPRGVLVTHSDPEGRKTIFDLFPDLPTDLRYAGRLDIDSEGLLLLTNQGEWIYRLTHPSQKVMKTYHAELDRRPSRAEMAALEEGIELEDGQTAPARCKSISPRPGIWCQISLHEGKNRQVRRMFEALGISVKRLIRVRFGPLTLGGLKPRQIRELTKEETREIQRLSHSSS